MRINLLAIFLLLSVCTTAQIQKGSILIGGDLSVNTSKYNSTDINQTGWKNQNYSISPVVGWAVRDNLVVGGRLVATFTTYDQSISPNVKSKEHLLGAGVWLRKYFPLGKSFYFFANADINGNSNYRKQTNSQTPLYYYKEKGFTVNAFAYPGIAYQVRKNIFLDAALNNLLAIGYASINSEQNNQDGTNYNAKNRAFNITSSLGAGVPLQLGLRWLIHGKTKG